MMRKLILLTLAVAMTALCIGTAQAHDLEAILAVGPGYTVAARDGNGADEGVDTYLDFGVRTSNHWSVGIRDAQDSMDRTIHNLSVWLRTDMTRYDTSDVIFYGRLQFGSLALALDGPSPDFYDGTWQVSGGAEYKQSSVFSLFAEAGGLYSVTDGDINSLGLKMGALFRFGTGEP